MWHHGAARMSGEDPGLLSQKDAKHPSFGSDSSTTPPSGTPSTFHLPTVAATGVGALLGLPFWPIGPLVGAAIGGAVDAWRWHKGHEVAVTVTPPGTPPSLATALASVGQTNKPGGPARIVLTTSGQFSNLPSPSDTAAAGAASAQAAANPIPEAVALQQYLKSRPYDYLLGDIFWTSNAMELYVSNFQTAANKDPAAVATLGQIPVTGLFGPLTAAAYAYYTHDPVAPDPNAAGS